MGNEGACRAILYFPASPEAPDFRLATADLTRRRRFLPSLARWRLCDYYKEVSRSGRARVDKVLLEDRPPPAPSKAATRVLPERSMRHLLQPL